MQIDSVLLRRSPAVLVYRILWVTIVVYIISSLSYTAIERLWLFFGIGGVFANRFLWSLLTLGTESLVMIFLFLQWSVQTYEIKDGEIVFRAGLLLRRMDIHSLRNMQTVYVKQGVLGRMFGYGNARLFNPMSKEELQLQSISDPYRYAELLRQVLDISSKDVMLRKR